MRLFVVLAAGLALLAASCGPKDGRQRDALRLSGKSPVDRPFTLKDQKPLDVGALVALLPERARPTFATAAFDKRLGATVVMDVVFPDPDGQGPRQPTSIRRLELYGVDRDAVTRIDAGGRNNAAPFETVFVKIRAFDIEPERREGEIASLGAVEWSNLRIRRGAFAPLGEARPTAAHFLNNFSLDGIYVKDWTVNAGKRKADALAFTAPDLRLVGIAGGRLGGFALKNAEYQFSMSQGTRAAFGGGFGPVIGALLNGPLGTFVFPADQRVKIGALEWRGVDLSGWMANELAGETIAMDARGLISLGTMRARNVDTYVRGRLASSVAETRVEMKDFVGVLPATIAATATGVVLDLAAYAAENDEAAVRILKERKLEKLRAENSFQWIWDASKGTAALKSDFVADRFATFSFALDLVDLEAAKMEAARNAGERADIVSFGALDSMRMRIEDVAMLDVLYALTAERSGQSPDELRRETQEGIRTLAAPVAGLDPRLGQLLQSLSAFLASGGAIDIVAAPKTPVAFVDLGAAGPDTLARTLNLSARHEPPKSKQ